MNVLNRTILEVKIGDRFYKFECSPESPLSEINSALINMQNYIGQKIVESESSKEQEVTKEPDPSQPVS